MNRPISTKRLARLGAAAGLGLALLLPPLDLMAASAENTPAGDRAEVLLARGRGSGGRGGGGRGGGGGRAGRSGGRSGGRTAGRSRSGGRTGFGSYGGGGSAYRGSKRPSGGWSGGSRAASGARRAGTREVRARSGAQGNLRTSATSRQQGRRDSIQSRQASRSDRFDTRQSNRSERFSNRQESRSDRLSERSDLRQDRADRRQDRFDDRRDRFDDRLDNRRDRIDDRWDRIDDRWDNYWSGWARPGWRAARPWVGGWYGGWNSWGWWGARSVAWGLGTLATGAIITDLVNDSINAQRTYIVVPDTSYQLYYTSVEPSGSDAVTFAVDTGSGVVQMTADCRQGRLNGREPATAAEAQLLNAACEVAYGD